MVAERRVLLALMLCLAVAGCSRFEPVVDPLARTDELIGYEIRVSTAEGSVYRFVLREVTESQLVGDLKRVPLDEVVQVERWHFSAKRTAILVGACAGAFLLPLLWTPWM